MKRILKRTSIFILIGLIAAACSPASRQRDVEQYIVQSENQWAESVATGDTTTIERILADDFVGVDPKGRFYDKSKMVSETRDAPKYFLSNRVNRVTVRFYGDTAVAQGDETWERRSGEPRRGRFVWTDTWVKRKGKWQIVAAEDLIAPEEQPKP